MKSEYQKPITEIILKAGNYVKNLQNKIKEVSTKEDGDVVSEADRGAEKLIKDTLKKYFPNFNYYGEEFGWEKRGSKFTFYIDPIDGTGRYLHKDPFYAVMISLVKGKETIVSSIYLPAEDKLYYAEAGKGAFLNGKKVSVSQEREIKSEKILLSSKVREQISKQIKAGRVSSISYDACMLASGKIDGIIKIYKKIIPVEGPAVFLLVKEAGGEVTNLNGQKYKTSNNGVIISNGKIHNKLIKFWKDNKSVHLKEDKELFELLDKKTQSIYKNYENYYQKDIKPFFNKISRDYEKTGRFPVHVLKMIKKIQKKDYDSAVCILRGGIPYALLFEATGWKIHCVRCGRKGMYSSPNRADLIFNENVDNSLNEIKGKKVLLIDNNSPSGNTPLRTLEELRRLYQIKKPDLFLDYYFPPWEHSNPGWLKKPFWLNKPRMEKFGKIFVAFDLKVSDKEHKELVKEFLELLRK